MAAARTAKKTNVATETVIGSAAVSLTKAVGEINAAVGAVKGLEERSEELSLQVANKTVQIEELDAQYTEKLRQKDVEFGLQFKENSAKVVGEFLSSNGDVAIAKTELNALRKDLEDTKANSTKEAEKAVAIVANKLKSEHESAIKLLESEHKGANIENTSKISSLETQNKFLESQLAKLYEQLDNERQASIERAKAGSIGAINVSGAGK